MKKEIHPALKVVQFKCASCGAVYEIESTSKQDTIHLDVCANCHPFYKGHALDSKAKGRAEKYASRIEKGQANIGKKVVKTTKKKKTNKKADFVTADEGE
jgi:large subunit ribosomal protein L31